MIKTAPSLGDFVVEYRNLSRARGAARVVIVHLTDDAGPEEVFSSCLARTGIEAERLAATWALEDGTCAWRALRADNGDAGLARIATEVASVATSPLRPGNVQSGILPVPMQDTAAPVDKRGPTPRALQPGPELRHGLGRAARGVTSHAPRS